MTSSVLRELKNFPAFHEHSQRAYRAINDLYVECQVIVQALRRIEKKDEGASIIEVPSHTKESAKIKRSAERLRALIHAAADRREYERVLVLMVALAEDHLFASARLVLRAFPERLEKSFKGRDVEIQISLGEIIQNGLDAIIEDRIAARILNASYASPSDYIRYLSSILHIALPEEALKDFIEIKATRDIIVHAGGIANERYAEKAGDKARAERGSPLIVDEQYFKSSVRTIKKLYDGLYHSMLSEYGDDERVAVVTAKKGI